MLALRRPCLNLSANSSVTVDRSFPCLKLSDDSCTGERCNGSLGSDFLLIHSFEVVCLISSTVWHFFPLLITMSPVAANLF